MPIYYLNTDLPIKEFYTDGAGIWEVLNLARPTELVRFKYYSGFDEFSGRKKTVLNSRAHPDMKIMTQWMLAGMVLRRLMDQHLHTEEFIIEFDSGMKADYRSNGDLIITYKENRTEELLKTFNVPKNIHAFLISYPGSLYFAIRRNGQFDYLGHYKRLSVWFADYEGLSKPKNLIRSTSLN